MTKRPKDDSPSSKPPRRDSDRTRTRPEPVVQRHVDRMTSSAPADLNAFELGFGEATAEPGSAMDLVEGTLPQTGGSDRPAPGGSALSPADIQDRYAVGDFTGALVIAESILELDPGNEEAQRYAMSCREVLTQMYAARLGPLSRIVTVSVPAEQVTWLSLDHRAGFLLSLVDGASTIEEILDISGMTRLEALRIIYTLVQQNVVALS